MRQSITPELATAAIFDDNASIVEGESVIVGRDEINKLEGDFLNAMIVMEMKHTIEGRTIQGDYAYQLGQLTGKLIVKADNSKIDMLNHYMAAWKNKKTKAGGFAILFTILKSGCFLMKQCVFEWKFIDFSGIKTEIPICRDSKNNC